MEMWEKFKIAPGPSSKSEAMLNKLGKPEHLDVLDLFNADL